MRSNTLKYALATFQLARKEKDTERMNDQMNVILKLYVKRGRLIIHWKKKYREAKKTNKSEVRRD
jgi:hypothetical protein